MSDTREITGLSFQPLRQWMDQVDERLQRILTVQQTQNKAILQLMDIVMVLTKGVTRE